MSRLKTIAVVLVAAAAAFFASTFTQDVHVFRDCSQVAMDPADMSITGRAATSPDHPRTSTKVWSQDPFTCEYTAH
ncbi:hypothetical protein [Modestobacter sp. KNN46-3]|uniref:hypothetical protein n=1 Tax=Modestobacter sp. KNN46-3 TaxID=2711218 RepID=UPI0013DF0EFE|nr:hypothetical protein [Modestobacter sp. KNN46-3]